MPAPQIPIPVLNPTRFRENLLNWYKRSHRPMPWRDTQDPYPIWLAEIMLQQTTVAAVIPYYQRFLQRFPSVQALASAPIEDVLHLWQGLGYYRRAHLLHKCAQTMVNDDGGHFPSTEEGLLQLPGVGPYTAAVVAACAFNQPANVVDGNVERVIARVFRIATPLPAAKPKIKAKAALLSSPEEPRLYANAIMELGSQICTPQNPQCLLCPVNEDCQAFHHKDQSAYPARTPKKQIPHRHATAWLITDNSGNLYLQQRPSTGLLASLWELPHSGWEPKSAVLQPPLPLPTTSPVGSYTHTFSHFKLTLNLHHATVENLPAPHTFSPTSLPPLPTLMRKALTTALSHLQS